MSKNSSLVPLIMVTAFYYLANSLTNIFLPNYWIGDGLGVNQIVVLLAAVFLAIGLFPILSLKLIPRHFERLMVLGILLNILFFGLLMFTNQPIILGVVWGVSLATFYPALNLLLYRMTRIRGRSMLVSLLYVTVPMIVGVIGPLIGGSLIHFFSFAAMFIAAIAFLAIALVFSLRINYEPAVGALRIPKSSLLWLFGIIIVIWGFAGSESYLAYPLFLNKLAGSFLNMGLVQAVIVLIMALVGLAVGKISGAIKHRINFAFFGITLDAVWLIILAFVVSVSQLIGASIMIGLADSMMFMLFALFGDFFKRREHATIVVLWEVFLMFGRLANLVPTVVFIGNFDFSGYFLVTGILSLTVVVPFGLLKVLHAKKQIAVDSSQHRS